MAAANSGSGDGVASKRDRGGHRDARGEVAIAISGNRGRQTAIDGQVHLLAAAEARTVEVHLASSSPRGWSNRQVGAANVAGTAQGKRRRESEVARLTGRKHQMIPGTARCSEACTEGAAAVGSPGCDLVVAFVPD